MRGEDNRRIRVLWMNRVNIESITLDYDFSRLITDSAQFAVKVICNCSFISRDRFDVDQLARKRDSVHGEENSK